MLMLCCKLWINVVRANSDPQFRSQCLKFISIEIKDSCYENRKMLKFKEKKAKYERYKKSAVVSMLKALNSDSQKKTSIL